MSVIVKGIEMPKNCDECRIMVFEDTNCVPELFCGCPIVFMAHPQGVGHRPDYCPLVEVPEGRVFGIRDGILYEATVKIPDNWGKTIKIPPIKLESEGKNVSN